MNIYFLMIAFQVKHYLSDFTFQTVYMLGKGKTGTAWILPLLTHASVHAAFTLLIALAVDPSKSYVALIDLVLHFIIDRIKARYRLKDGVWEPHEKGYLLGRYYAAFGKDQLAHHLTYVLIIYLLEGKL